MASPPVPTVEIRRSARRRRSVQAYRDGATIVILMPARLSAAEEAQWVETMVQKVQRRERRVRPSDADLLARAHRLSETYLDGSAVPRSIRWVSNQTSRWGSCTPSDASIRLSERLQPMPDWVVDYVIVHELTHLLVANHDTRFWDYVGRYPRTERARGYLDGVSATAGLTHLHDD